MKLKISMSYIPLQLTTLNITCPVGTETLQASFLEDFVPPSKLISHIIYYSANNSGGLYRGKKGVMFQIPKGTLLYDVV